jgi:hypothetical protein
MQVPQYRAASKELLAQAKQDLAAGYARQASEKGWGAAAQTVKALAADRGWPHHAHPLLHQAAGRLARETGDRQISTLFHVANSLHGNFYKNWFAPEVVEDGLRDVELLIEKLEPLL